MGFSPLQVVRSNHPLIRFLGSVKLAVILLVAIGLACIAGTLIIQANTVPGLPEDVYRFYVNEYGPFWHRVFNALSFYRLYSSWWFSALLLLLVVNMFVCALRRLRWRWTQLGFQLTHLSIVFLLIGVVIGLHGEEGTMRIFEGEESSTLVVGRRTPVPNSPQQAHALTHERETTDDAPVETLDFALFLEDFEVQRHDEPLDSIRVQSARSDERQSYNLAFQTRIARAAGEPWDIEVLETKPLIRKTSRVVAASDGEGQPAYEIEVSLNGRHETGWLMPEEPRDSLRLPNDSRIEYRRCESAEDLHRLLAEENIGSTPTRDMLAVALNDGPPTTFPLQIGEPRPLAGSSLSVTILRFFPDWKLDRNRRRAFSASNERRNPAIEVRVAQGETSRTVWVFSRFPEFQGPVELDDDIVALRFLEAGSPQLHDLRLLECEATDERFLQRYDRGRLVDTIPASAGNSVALSGGLRVRLLRRLESAVTETVERKDPDGFVARLRFRNRRTGEVEEGEVDSGRWLQQGHLVFRLEREFPIKQFVSHVRVIDEGQTIRDVDIAMNAPLKYGGYTFYQSSYDSRAGDASRYTVLSVKRDPGVWFVYLGFSILTVGLAVVFYVNPWLRRGSGERER